MGGIPLALNFAVKQVPGLEGLPTAVVTGLQSVSTKLEAKLTLLFKNLRTTLAATFKPPAGLIGQVHEFKVDGVTHTLWLAEQPDKTLRVMLDGIGDAAKLDLETDLPKTLSAKMRHEVQAAVALVLTHGETLRTMNTGHDSAAGVASLIGRGGHGRSNNRSRNATAATKSRPVSITRSIAFRFVEHPKQWARLFRGFTYASISPHRGHRNTNRPSRSFDGGPARGRDCRGHRYVVPEPTQHCSIDRGTCKSVQSSERLGWADGRTLAW